MTNTEQLIFRLASHIVPGRFTRETTLADLMFDDIDLRVLVMSVAAATHLDFSEEVDQQLLQAKTLGEIIDIVTAQQEAAHGDSGTGDLA